MGSDQWDLVLQFCVSQVKQLQGKTLSRCSLPPSFTPSMAAGVTDKLWEMSDMVKVLEDWEATN
jgi:hypothetical protein